MLEKKLTEPVHIRDLTMLEATTRKEIFECVNEKHEPYDFTGFQAHTYVAFKGRPSRSAAVEHYLETKIENNEVSFIIPAAYSVGMGSGVYETRIFKDGEVYGVVTGDITVMKSKKADLTPHT